MVPLDAYEIANQQKFNLTISTEDEQPKKKLRLEKKSFAIACYTNMTRKIRFTNEPKND